MIASVASRSVFGGDDIAAKICRQRPSRSRSLTKSRSQINRSFAKTHFQCNETLPSTHFQVLLASTFAPHATLIRVAVFYLTKNHPTYHLLSGLRAFALIKKPESQPQSHSLLVLEPEVSPLTLSPCHVRWSVYMKHSSKTGFHCPR